MMLRPTRRGVMKIGQQLLHLMSFDFFIATAANSGDAKMACAKLSCERVNHNPTECDHTQYDHITSVDTL